MSKPSLLFELDDLLSGHPVQPLVQLPHAEVDELLGGAEAVTGLILGYLLVADDCRLLTQDGVVCAAWISHLSRVMINGDCEEVDCDLSQLLSVCGIVHRHPLAQPCFALPSQIQRLRFYQNLCNLDFKILLIDPRDCVLYICDS